MGNFISKRMAAAMTKDEIASLARVAIGAGDPGMQVPRVAYHELGHAVVSFELGITVYGMHVIIWGDGDIAGQVQTFIEGADPSDVLAGMVAGQAAEKIAGFRQRYSWRTRAGRHGLASDAEQLQGRGQKEAAIGKAEAILKERWPIVEQLAEEIIAAVYRSKHFKLDGEELHARLAGESVTLG